MLTSCDDFLFSAVLL